MFETLDHLVIAVRDLARSTETLCALLGRRPSWRGVHPSYGTANTLFRLDNTYVELLAPESSGTLADKVGEWLAKRGEGLLALSFGTGDAEACVRELRARGLHADVPAAGNGRESTSGAERSWKNFLLPQDETRGVTLMGIEHVSPPERLPLAEIRGDAAAAIAAVDHVVVDTTDAEAASALYGGRLGLRLALDKTFPEWGARLLFFRLGGITVEIAARLGESGGERPDRLWGISYRVPDAEAARERLSLAGFDVSEVRTGRKPGTRVCTVRGEPCGVATLLISPAAA